MKFFKTILSKQMIHDAYEAAKFNPQFPDSYFRYDVSMLLSDALKELAFIVGKHVQEFRAKGTLTTYMGETSTFADFFLSADDLFHRMECGAFDDLIIDLYEDQGTLITIVRSDIDGTIRNYQIESIQSSSLTPFNLQTTIESFIAEGGSMIDYLTPSLANTLRIMGFEVPVWESQRYGHWTNKLTWQCVHSLESTFDEWYSYTEAIPSDGEDLKQRVSDYLDSLLLTQPKETLDYFGNIVFGFELIDFDQIHHDWIKEDC